MATADVYSAVLALFKSRSFELRWRIVVESNVRIILEKRAAAKLTPRPTANSDVERKRWNETRRRCGQKNEEAAAAAAKRAKSRFSFEDDADPAFPDGVDDPAFFEADPPSVGLPFVQPEGDEDWIKRESEADLADSGGEWGSGGSSEWDLLDPYVVPPAPPPPAAPAPHFNPYVALRSIDHFIGGVDKPKKNLGDLRTSLMNDGDGGDDGDDYVGDNADTFIPPFKVDGDVGPPAAGSGLKEEDMNAPARRGVGSTRFGKLKQFVSRAPKKFKQPTRPASMNTEPSVGLASRENIREAENNGSLTNLTTSSNSTPYISNGTILSAVTTGSSSGPISSTSSDASAALAAPVASATLATSAATINSTALFASVASTTTVSNTDASTIAAASTTSAISASPDTASATGKRKYQKQPLPRARYGDRSNLKMKKIQRPIVKKPCPLCKKTNYGNKYLRTHIKRCHPRSLLKIGNKS